MLHQDAKWFAVSLRFEGDGFDPRVVESLLGLAPTSIRIAGEKWIGKNGREYGPARGNVWCHFVDAPSEMGFERQIGMLLAEVREVSDAIRNLAAADQVEAEISCGFGSGNGQGGDRISADTLRQVASLGLSLALDLYPPDIDEAPEEIQSEQVVPPNGCGGVLSP